jgi:hypothetical protein
VPITDYPNLYSHGEELIVSEEDWYITSKDLNLASKNIWTVDFARELNPCEDVSKCEKSIYKVDTTYKATLNAYWEKADDVKDYLTDTKSPDLAKLGDNKA